MSLKYEVVPIPNIHKGRYGGPWAELREAARSAQPQAIKIDRSVVPKDLANFSGSLNGGGHARHGGLFCYRSDAEHIYIWFVPNGNGAKAGE